MRHAALLGLLVTACTGSIESDGDPSGNGSKSAVQIAIRDGQAPQAGVLVVFQRADGTVAAEVQSDASGTASAELPAGGSVTVIRTYPTPPDATEPIPAQVYTYVGVKPGDRLTLGKTTADQGTASAVLVKVPQGANGTIKVTTPCGAGQGTAPLVAITVRGCDPQTFVYVQDGNNSSFFKKLAFSENMDVSGEALLGAVTSTVSATNVAPGSAVTFEQRLASDGFTFFSAGAKRIETNPANVTLPPLQGVEQLLVTTTSLNGRTQMVATRSAFDQSLVTVDASAGLIASPAELKGDPITGLSWTETAPAAPAVAATPDAVLVTLSVQPKLVTSLPYVRMIVAPHAGASLQLPVLAGSAAIYNPAKDDQVSRALGLVQATGGYDALRGRAFATANIVDSVAIGGQITLSYTGTAPVLK